MSVFWCYVAKSFPLGFGTSRPSGEFPSIFFFYKASRFQAWRGRGQAPGRPEAGPGPGTSEGWRSLAPDLMLANEDPVSPRLMGDQAPVSFSSPGTQGPPSALAVKGGQAPLPLLALRGRITLYCHCHHCHQDSAAEGRGPWVE